MVAYACRITEENMGAISSEHPNFDLEATRAWLEYHGSGYFLRDESSVLDCQYFADEVFFEMYVFAKDAGDEMFKRVVHL